MLTTTLLLLMAPLAGCGEEDPVERCVLSQECPLSTVCWDGKCLEVGCYISLDCPVDAVCHNGERRCVSLQCRRSRDCQDRPQTPYCVGGVCQASPPPECRSRNQCGVGETCRAGACMDVPESSLCYDNEDCGNPEICDPYLGEHGVCTPPCTRNADCEQYDDLRACETSSGHCRPVDCLQREHCDEYEVCSPDYQCEPELFECAPLICEGTDRPFKTEPIDGMCRCVQCLSDNHCSQTAREVCSSSRRCLYCEFVGAEAADCPEEHPLFQEGCCLDCLEHSHCEHLGQGSFCSRGRCIECNCTAGCACPSGTDCQYSEDLGHGICVPGGGDLGEPCQAQTDCRADLACSFADGECVEQGSGSFCTESGCPPPSRCAIRPEGALCYGCTDPEECPPDFFCYIPSEDWDYQGGLCLPSE